MSFSFDKQNPQIKTFSWWRERGQDETVITHSRMLGSFPPTAQLLL